MQTTRHFIDADEKCIRYFHRNSLVTAFLLLSNFNWCARCKCIKRKKNVCCGDAVCSFTLAIDSMNKRKTTNRFNFIRKIFDLRGKWNSTEKEMKADHDCYRRIGARRVFTKSASDTIIYCFNIGAYYIFNYMKRKNELNESKWMCICCRASNWSRIALKSLT